jgi:hypothetical protein
MVVVVEAADVVVKELPAFDFPQAPMTASAIATEHDSRAIGRDDIAHKCGTTPSARNCAAYVHSPLPRRVSDPMTTRIGR